MNLNLFFTISPQSFRRITVDVYRPSQPFPHLNFQRNLRPICNLRIASVPKFSHKPHFP